MVGAIGGRWTAPERVRVEERTRVEWKDRVEYKDRIVEKRVEGPVRTRTVREYAPPTPGVPCPVPVPIRETIIEIRDPVTVDRTTDSAGTATSTGTQETRRVEIPAPPPTWRAGALVALDVGALNPAAPASAFIVGGRIERRLFGPVNVGAFALVPLARPLAPVAGLSLSVEW
jgi:hypothetical protein